MGIRNRNRAVVWQLWCNRWRGIADAPERVVDLRTGLIFFPFPLCIVSACEVKALSQRSLNSRHTISVLRARPPRWRPRPLPRALSDMSIGRMSVRPSTYSIGDVDVVSVAGGLFCRSWCCIAGKSNHRRRALMMFEKSLHNIISLNTCNHTPTQFCSTFFTPNNRVLDIACTPYDCLYVLYQSEITFGRHQRSSYTLLSALGSSL